MQRIPVGVLGATGAVGQRFIRLLADHPWFEITALAASERSAGQRYADVCIWRLSADCPESVRDIVVQPTTPDLDCRIVFSALPGSIAQEAEEQFAAAGYGVLSNASAHRMDPDVPLLIPEVNADHLGLLETQRKLRGWDRGFIVAEPNCSTVGITIPLKPIYDAFGLRRVVVTTLQALSGAGYPGVPSLDSLDNVIPFIGNEEEKLVEEPPKILGRLNGEAGTIEHAAFPVSPTCTRVPVRDGHMAVLSVELERKASLEELAEALASFQSEPAALGCPSAVDPTIILRSEPNRPQTYLDRDNGRGMAITVGRIRTCEVLDYKLVMLSHNTVRGAAGASILNAELMVAKGMIQ